MQNLAFIGSSRGDLREFPDGARREAGYQLDKVQRGEQPTDFKPMKTVGSGTYEIRIKGSGDEYRVFYVAKFGDTVYVLHTFQKKSRKTPERHLNIGRRRYEVAKEHAEGWRSIYERYLQSTTFTMNDKITKSSGNAFEDLGFEGGEAENLRVRARLMAPLERYVRERGITQEEAAEELVTTQARISELVNGKIQAFSIDALINMLNRAGLEVDVDVRPKKEA